MTQDYYRNLLARLEPIVVCPWRETLLWIVDPPLARLAQDAIQPDQCWYNAYAVAKCYCDLVQYVEGLVLFDDGIVEHGWNVTGGKHFDLTWERYRPSYLRVSYFPVICGSVKDLQAQGYEFKPQEMTMMGQYERMQFNGRADSSQVGFRRKLNG
jgi:hypothetical protein